MNFEDISQQVSGPHNQLYLCKWLRRVVLFSSLTVIVLGAGALYGSLSSMANTGGLTYGDALANAAFVFSGLALLLLNLTYAPGKSIKVAALTLAVVVAIIGMTGVLGTTSAGASDHFLAPTWYASLSGMSLQTAVSLIALAGIIFGIGYARAPIDHFTHSTAVQAAQITSIMVGAFAVAAGIGQIYGFIAGSAIGIELRAVSVTCLALCGIAGLLSRPTHRPAAILLSDTVAGAVARTVLPSSCMVAPVIGCIHLVQPRIDLFLLVLLVGFVLPLVIWLLVNIIERAERERTTALEQTQTLNKKMNTQVGELLSSYSQANEALKARSEFIAKMSHELRTPLGVVISSNELLLLTPLSAEQAELVELAADSSHNLLRLINDILDFAKLEADKLHIENDDCQLSTVIDSAVTALKSKAAQKGLSLTSTICATVPYLVNVDSGRLRQILMNLIENAIKFTDHGRVLLQVSLAFTKDRQELLFLIKDTGIGIPASFSTRMFQPWVQADGSLTRRYGGTGLGLSICKSLVELMGGQIGAQSTIGEGSDFWFTLPLVRCGARSPAATAVDLQEIAILNSGSTILLAEDNPVNAKITSLQLRRLGYHADVVSNGKEAVDALCSKRYDLVLMDIQMPEMDGLEATKFIRRNERGSGRHVPIIALTAHAMASDRDICLSAGMDDYISKPPSLQTLAATVKNFVGQGTNIDKGSDSGRSSLQFGYAARRLQSNERPLQSSQQLSTVEGNGHIE